MKRVGLAVLIVTALVGCGTAPSATAPRVTSDSARASGLIGGIFFKEAAYQQVTLAELSAMYDAPAAHAGKKVRATGFVGARAPEFGVGDYVISLFDAQQPPSQVTLFSGSSIFSSKARKLDKELHAGTHEVVTVYLEVDAKDRFEVKAVKYADGKLNTL
ncbi:MAG TPA: hypothetical protein V6D00_06645 [Pantanalinema sp.]